MCLDISYEAMKYKEHIKHVHKITKALDESIEKDHLIANAQDRFWCGFCYKIIELQKKGEMAAWEERHSHLGNHFECADKMGCAYKDYVHVHFTDDQCLATDFD